MLSFFSSPTCFLTLRQAITTFLLLYALPFPCIASEPEEQEIGIESRQEPDPPILHPWLEADKPRIKERYLHEDMTKKYQEHRKKIKAIAGQVIEKTQTAAHEDPLVGYKLGLLFFHKMKQQIQAFLRDPRAENTELEALHQQLSEEMRQQYQAMFTSTKNALVTTQPNGHTTRGGTISRAQRQHLYEEYASVTGTTIDPKVEAQLLAFVFHQSDPAFYGCGLESHIGCPFAGCIPTCRMGGTYGRREAMTPVRLQAEAGCSYIRDRYHTPCCGPICACPSLSCGAYWGKKAPNIGTSVPIEKIAPYCGYFLQGIWKSIGCCLCFIHDMGLKMEEESCCSCSLPLCTIKESPDLDQFLTAIDIVSTASTP